MSNAEELSSILISMNGVKVRKKKQNYAHVGRIYT